MSDRVTQRGANERCLSKWVSLHLSWWYCRRDFGKVYFSAFHDGVAHLGFDNTREALERRVWWPQLQVGDARRCCVDVERAALRGYAEWSDTARRRPRLPVLRRGLPHVQHCALEWDDGRDHGARGAEWREIRAERRRRRLGADGAVSAGV